MLHCYILYNPHIHYSNYVTPPLLHGVTNVTFLNRTLTDHTTYSLLRFTKTLQPRYTTPRLTDPPRAKGKQREGGRPFSPCCWKGIWRPETALRRWRITHSRPASFPLLSFLPYIPPYSVCRVPAGTHIPIPRSAGPPTKRAARAGMPSVCLSYIRRVYHTRSGEENRQKKFVRYREAVSAGCDMRNVYNYP